MRFDRHPGLRLSGLRLHGLRLHGLYKTINIAKPLPICQIKKYHQTRVGGISPNPISSIYGYIGDRGYKGLSKYRRIPPISHIETLNVSHNGIGRKMGGYIKKHLTPIGIYRHMGI